MPWPANRPTYRHPAAMLASWLLVLSLCAGPVLAAGGDRLTAEGLRHLHGEGVAADPERALVYFCAAARQKDPRAAFELGWMYLEGRGVVRDDALALAWFERAGELGEPAPPRLMQRLASVRPAARACVSARGTDLEIVDRRRAELAIAIYEIAPQYGLDPALVFEVVRAESNFNPRARSHKGALGLMQLIPATAKRFGVEDPFEPRQNLHGGMAYLSWLLQRFGGDLRLTLAGYNAGEGAVERYGDVPPYEETREYVRRILSRYPDGRA